MELVSKLCVSHAAHGSMTRWKNLLSRKAKETVLLNPSACFLWLELETFMLGNFSTIFITSSKTNFSFTLATQFDWDFVIFFFILTCMNEQMAWRAYWSGSASPRNLADTCRCTRWKHPLVGSASPPHTARRSCRGLGCRALGKERKERKYEHSKSYTRKKNNNQPLPRTRLGQIAGVSTEAIGTDADKWIISDSCHTRPPVMAEIHLTVVTCRRL